MSALFKVADGVDVSYGVSRQAMLAVMAAVSVLARHGEDATVIQIEYHGHAVYFSWGALTSHHMRESVRSEIREALPDEFAVRHAQTTQLQKEGLAVSWLPGVHGTYPTEGA